MLMLKASIWPDDAPNEDKIVLERTPWTAPVEVKVAGPDERTLLYRGGETIEWQVVACTTL